MSILKLAQLDPSEAFPAMEEEAYQDENSFLSCYLDGLAGIDDVLGDDDSDDELGS